MAGWAAAVDGAPRLALFELALFHHLADAIAGRPSLRDALLAAYVQRQCGGSCRGRPGGWAGGAAGPRRQGSSR